MVEWIVQTGIYLLGWILLVLGGAALVVWGLLGGRSRGRARCPRCWYDMRGRRPGPEGLTCPECGHHARTERRLYRNRRRWRAIVPGAILLALLAYPSWVIGGWCREQWAVRPVVRMEGDAVWWYSVATERLSHRLPGPLAQFYDRAEAVRFFRRPATDADLPRLQWLKHVNYINLRQGNITDEGLLFLRRLRSVTVLNLEQTKVTDGGLDHIARMTWLTNLRLNSLPITDAGLAKLANLTELRKLDLSGTQVTDEGLVQLGEMKRRLFALGLARTGVTDAGIAQLRQFKELWFIRLDGTAVTDAGLANIISLPRLHHLGLSRTAVTDEGLKLLESVRSLRRLTLRGTKTTDWGVSRLQKARSDLVIWR